LAVLITTVSYLFIYLCPFDAPWFWPVFILNLWTPLALFSAAQSFFSPGESPYPWLVLAMTQVCLCIWAVVVGLPLPTPLVTLIMSVNSLTAIMIGRTLWRQSRDDLISVRRDLRMIMTIMLGIYIIGVGVFTSIASSDDSYRMPLRALEAMILMAMVFTLNASLVRREFWDVIWGLEAMPQVAEQAQERLERQKRQIAMIALKDQQVQAIKDLFEKEKLYLSQKLTIADVAVKIGIPEHQLRSLINQHLGFENFNHFVNQYRIDHVTRLLRDPTRVKDKVFALALESGFSSLAPFNRAFMETHKITPSAYRNQNIPASEKPSAPSKSL
jgi:AraC-like DNA-binding protein